MPNIKFPDGGYAALNDTIPAFDEDSQFEFYLGDETMIFGFDESKKVTSKDV
jgi:hypothetical protein